ncbi:hypothetical protein [Bradyrhizobium sp. USDA 4350]
MNEWSIIIAAGSLEVIILSSVAGIVWKLSRLELAIRTESDLKITALQKDHSDKIAALQKDHAEKEKTLSDKVYQIEIWARDEFVRKGSFEIVIARMEKSMEKIGDKIDAKFADLTQRIDQAVHPAQH